MGGQGREWGDKEESGDVGGESGGTRKRVGDVGGDIIYVRIGEKKEWRRQKGNGDKRERGEN